MMFHKSNRALVRKSVYGGTYLVLLGLLLGIVIGQWTAPLGACVSPASVTVAPSQPAPTP